MHAYAECKIFSVTSTHSKANRLCEVCSYSFFSFYPPQPHDQGNCVFFRAYTAKQTYMRARMIACGGAGVMGGGGGQTDVWNGGGRDRLNKFIN